MAKKPGFHAEQCPIDGLVTLVVFLDGSISVFSQEGWVKERMPEIALALTKTYPLAAPADSQGAGT